MFFEQNKSDIQRDLDYSIKTGLHQIKILALLRNNLPKFSKDFKAPIATLKQDVNINFENYISQELSFFLNNKVNQSGYLLGFQATGPDIFVRLFGVGVHGLTLLFIEAKRLPPSSPQDYVKTGIRRFKKEEHGKQHNVAAMLGYVQEEDFIHWYKTINSWIDDLIRKVDESPAWVEQDKLSRVKEGYLGEYNSIHSRVSKDPIALHHFWIKLN